MNQADRMPPGWSSAQLIELAGSLGGGTPPTSDPTFWTDGSIPWVSPKDMKVFEIRDTQDRLSSKALDRLELVPRASVLVVVRSGILARTLPVALNSVPVTINQDMRAFLPVGGILPRYLGPASLL